MLLDKGLVEQKQIERALEYQQKSGDKLKLGEILVKLGFVDPMDILGSISEQFDVPVVDLRQMKPTAEALDLVPRNVARMHNVIPVNMDGQALVVAMDDLDLATIDDLQFILDIEIRPVLATSEQINEAMDRSYGAEDSTVGTMLREFTESDVSFTEMSASELSESSLSELSGLERGGGETATDEGQGDAAIIRLVNLLITEAVRARASDVHFEPLTDRLRVRYRIDGVCQEIEAPPKRLQAALTARLKLMAGMDLAEKRRPQDGRIPLRAAGRDLDMRVSAVPTTDGESIVMRILDKESIRVSLTELGFHESDLRRFEAVIRQPNGILLVTGPTGSGKTTTLYAALNELNRPDTKILTAEDPVEYMITGINQSQVHTEIGRTFPVILRAMLRQAPEIILVGEIRDSETAEIAIRAALTGHLVFSTLHTNDAASSIPRLIDLGIKPFLVASSVLAVMAQRLVRRICTNCKAPHVYPKHYLKAVGLQEEDVEGLTLYHGEGCHQCSGTGYRARVAIFELMEMTQEIRDLAYSKAPAGEIRTQARTLGMLTLLEDGLRKVMQGTSTIEEVMRVAGNIEDID